MLTTVLCRMKSDECGRKGIYGFGFVNPVRVNARTLKNHVKDTEKNLLNALMKQHFNTEIMFPYFFR